MSAFTLQDFWDADGYKRIGKIIRSTLSRKAIATGASVDDLVHDATLSAIEKFDAIMAKCPPDRDAVDHVVLLTNCAEEQG